MTKKCPQVEILELKEAQEKDAQRIQNLERRLKKEIALVKAAGNFWKDEAESALKSIDELKEELDILRREFDIVENACDFWKDEAESALKRIDQLLLRDDKLTHEITKALEVIESRRADR